MSEEIYDQLKNSDHFTEVNGSLFHLQSTVFWDHVTIGKGCIIHSGAVIGAHGENWPHRPWGHVTIGSHCEIRPGATVDAGTTTETVIGDYCLIMTKGHIGHDAKLGRHVVVSSGASIGGFAILEDHVNIGLNAAVHQHRTIGRGAMVGMCSPATRDIPAGMIAHTGNAAKPTRENTIGLRRAEEFEREHEA